MREGWEIKKLGEVCKIQTGKLDANAKVDDGEYPFFTCDSKPYRIDKFAFDDEAILISGNGSLVGHVNYYNGKFNAYQRTYVLTQFSSYYIPFLISYLKGYLRPYIMENKKGGCIPYITLPILQNFSIPTPPLSEQEQIVAELDLISGVIDKKKQQLKELDSLAQSIFYEMFGDPVENEKGWEVKKLGEVCKFSQGVQVDLSLQSLEKKDGFNRFLRIVDYTMLNTDIRYVNITDVKYFVKPDDVVVVRYGASAGVVGIKKEGVLANNLFKLNHDKNVLNYIYLSRLLSTDYYKSFVRNIAFGAAMPALNFNSFKMFNTIIPPLSLQQEFASRIEKIERQKELIKQSLAETETLFNSRMDFYFNS